MSEWQPIKTAPKGRHWYSDLPDGSDEGPGWAIYEDDYTFAFLVWWKDCGDGSSQVTHWMPAPEPPASIAHSADA